MKRTTEIELRLRNGDYQKGGDLGLCEEFVNSLVKGEPKRILVQVSAVRVRGYKVARRYGYDCVRVGLGDPQFAYWLVRSTLTSIGVASGDKFWFRITAL